MKKTKYFLLVAICIVFVTTSFAQRNYAIKNGIGLQGGITQFDIITENVITQSNRGFLGGMSASVDLPHKWYEVSYNIQLSENNIDILGETPATAMEEFIEYKMLAAQISFLLHVKLIKDNFTLDLGPMLQYNGDLELKDDSKEGYLVSGLDNVFTENISDVSNFNVNGAVGLSLGISVFQIRAQYIYGFTNLLGSLNNKDFSTDKFKGNQSLLVFSAIFTF